MFVSAQFPFYCINHWEERGLWYHISIKAKVHFFQIRTSPNTPLVTTLRAWLLNRITIAINQKLTVSMNFNCSIVISNYIIIILFSYTPLRVINDIVDSFCNAHKRFKANMNNWRKTAFYIYPDSLYRYFFPGSHKNTDYCYFSNFTSTIVYTIIYIIIMMQQ